jgi:formylglycine-generating enzyme required for sulfatase activity/predicted Ser/Thr protein kinase
MTLSTGQILQGRYHILSHIGQGGMGVVYQAQDMRLNNRLVAVKEFDPAQLSPTDRPTALQAFQQEAAILAGLNHPGLTAVYDYFLDNNKFYLVMEFVHGETLEQRWERAGRRFAEAEVVAWAQELCEVLAYLHNQQPPIIFRDLKPANIMVSPNSRLKLIDFGIARHFDPTKTSDTTNFGTPGYAAPEQYGHGQTDARSDVYALGAVVHQLLTGYEPDSTPFNLPDMTAFGLNLSLSLVTAVRQATQIDPAQRPSSAAAFRQMLDRTVSPALPMSQVWKWMGAGAFLILLLGGFWYVGFSENSSREATAVPQLVAAPPITLTPTLPQPSMTPSLTPTPTHSPMPTRTATETVTPAPTATPIMMLRGDGRRQTAVLIPAGEFIMGTEAEVGLAECRQLLITESCQLSWFQDEEPVHTVYLDAFYMDRYEVTNQAFVAFLNAQGNQFAGGNTWLDVDAAGVQRPVNYRSGRWQVDPGWENHPIIYATWYGAQAFCQWQDGRLPSEAEWEKAARGSAYARLYPWGNSFTADRANICDSRCPTVWANRNLDDGYATTAPVGSYPNGVSPYGLYDMTGNVFEWTADWYAPDYYARSPAINPPGPESGARYVARGGSWRRNGRGVRLSYRFSFEAHIGYEDVGFRCAYTP